MPELPGLQYLRGYAATVVVIFHLGEQINRFNPAFPHLQTFASGVDLFFVLSGFVMVYSTDLGTKLSPWGFFERRLVRIVPLYWAITLLLAGVALVLPQLVQSARFSPSHFFGSLFFIPVEHPVVRSATVPFDYMPLLVPGWTLNYEIAFYLLFAAAIAAGRRRASLVVPIASTAILLLVAAGLSLRPDGLLRFYTDPILLEFLFGMVLAMGLLRFPRLPRLSLLSGSALSIVAAGVMLFVPHNTWPVMEERLLCCVMASVMVFAAATTALPRSMPLRLLGDASYSLYLSQVPVVSALSQVAKRLGLMSTLNGQWAFIVGGTIASIVAALLCWWIVEKPLTHAARRMVGGVTRRSSVSDG